MDTMTTQQLIAGFSRLADTVGNKHKEIVQIKTGVSQMRDDIVDLLEQLSLRLAASLVLPSHQ